MITSGWIVDRQGVVWTMMESGSFDMWCILFLLQSPRYLDRNVRQSTGKCKSLDSDVFVHRRRWKEEALSTVSCCSWFFCPRQCVSFNYFLLRMQSEWEEAAMHRFTTEIFSKRPNWTLWPLQSGLMDSPCNSYLNGNLARTLMIGHWGMSTE